MRIGASEVYNGDGKDRKRREGLPIVTGAAGSGKSTTLAAIVDYINRNKPKHIITVEDSFE